LDDEKNVSANILVFYWIGSALPRKITALSLFPIPKLLRFCGFTFCGFAVEKFFILKFSNLKIKPQNRKM